MPEKSLSFNFTTNLSTWSSLNPTGTLTRTILYDQMKREPKTLEYLEIFLRGVVSFLPLYSKTLLDVTGVVLLKIMISY